jgi:uncharacterized protein DUF5655
MSKNNTQPENPHFDPSTTSFFRWANRSAPTSKPAPAKPWFLCIANMSSPRLCPPTNSRIDLGLCFTTYKGKLPKRLLDTGGLAKKDRITHRIQVSSPSDSDAELRTWFRAAYDLNA